MRNTIKIFAFISAIALCICLCCSTFLMLDTAGTALAATESALTIEGNYAYIGEYPQTMETDETILAALATATQGADGYYTYNGNRYAKCVAEIQSEHGVYSDGSTPMSGETKYFKVEPIKWRILGKSADEDMLWLISVNVLDTHAWQTQATLDAETGKYVYTYTNSKGNTDSVPAYDWQSGTWTQSGSTVRISISGSWGINASCTISSDGDELSYNGSVAYRRE